MDYNPFRSGATQKVQENKFVIPEEVPATERTAFHGAAAAAHKAGKSSFSFAGKKHPVTMKKDTANAIADQNEKFVSAAQRKAVWATAKDGGKGHPDNKKKKEDVDEGYYKDMEIKKQDKAMGAKPVPSKKKKEAKGGGKEGDVEMNPKMEKDSKSNAVEAKEDTIGEMQSYRVGHKSVGGNVHAKDENDAMAQLRKKGVKGNITLTHRGPVKNLPKVRKVGESRIRSALKSVLSEKSRDDHYKSSTDPEMMKDKIKGKGAEDMMKGANDEIAKGPDAHLDEPAMINKDAAKMTSNVPKGKARNNDNAKGDTKIKPGGTPMKDPAAMKVESFGAQVSSMAAAYAVMNAPVEEVEEKDAD